MGLVWETGHVVCSVKPNQNMKVITFNSNWASFAYRLNAEIGEDCTSATEWLCQEQALANIGYRIAGSRIDKALGVKSKKNGGMGREGVSFDPKHIPTIESAVSAAITEMENDEKLGKFVKELKLSFAVTGEYVPQSTGVESKEATELWTKVQALPAEGDGPGTFGHAMAKLGFKEDPKGEFEYDDDSGIAACKRHIQAEKAKAKLAAAGALGL